MDCRRAMLGPVASLLAILLTGDAWGQVPAQVPAQTRLLVSKRAPSAGYFSSFGLIYDGRYKQALESYQTGLRTAIKTLQQRWVDSICYNTMVGECQYRLGNYAAALDSYMAALRLFMQYSDWMLLVRFPDTIDAANVARAAPWGRSTRNARLGRFPEGMPIVMLMAGATNNAEQALRQGGAYQQPQYISATIQEIVRCTCLAMMRRRQIMGPLVTYDSLTDEVMSHANRRSGPPNHWCEAWLDAQQGFAFSAAGKTGQAVEALKRSLLVQGQYDHPVTGLALLELGNLSMEAGDYRAASGFYEEATYASAEFSDGIVVEEAFRGWWLAQLLGGDVGSLDAPLAAAAGWARKGNRELQTSLTLLAAEGLALRGQTPQATALLADAKTNMQRRDMSACEIGSRFQYITAITHYQRGTVAAGDEALTAALQWQKDGAKRLFQIALADNLCVNNASGRFTPRVAVNLYETLLQDPTPADWSARPLESLAVLASPHPAPFEHWFEAALQHAPETALEVADRARRHRFLSTLPLGGRLLALRWLLEGPEESLDNNARLQRQELLVRYEKYAEASRKAKQLRNEMVQRGLGGEALETQRELGGKLDELAALSATQESILREMAVRREAAEIVFPPIRTLKEVQQSLQPGQLLLAFFTTSRGTYGWLYSNQQSAQWKLNNPEAVEKNIVALLRALGNFDGNREVQETQLADPRWKQSASETLDALLKNSKVTFDADFSELIVVPDGLLWYLPFELLPVGDAVEYRPMISRTRIRYAPTVGLSIPDREGRKPAGEFAVVLGKMHPADTPEVNDAALEQIRRAAASAVPLPNQLPVPSPVLGALFDGLIVWDDLNEGKAGEAKGPYDWSPIPLDRGKGVGTLAAWLTLPWKHIDQFILPGFHTAAENGLKPMPANPGSELFLATTGLMAGGARTVLISRWRIGGQTTVELVREFIQELPYVTADEAWQRAVQLVRQTPLDLTREPRVRRAPNTKPMQAEHPFFWAGYMLIDSGATPEKSDRPAEKPALKASEPKATGKQAAN